MKINSSFRVFTSLLSTVKNDKKNCFLFVHANVHKVSWCSWLSRQSNTLKVSGSNSGEAIYLFFPIPKDLMGLYWAH